VPHILVDTKGRIADIQMKFRRDNKAMEGENRRIINRVTEVKKKCRWNIQKRKSKIQVGPALT